jgi:hypothetical protein
MAKKTAAPAAEPEDNERNELVAKIEGDLPYDRDRVIQETKFFIQRSAESIIEAGKRLLLLKEKEEYGDFTRIVTEDIGIPYATAWRFMNAALKVDKFPGLTSTLSKMDKVTKIYTLLEAPEEDLKELEDKGVMAGKDIDEISAMSVKEMRALIKSLKTETDKIVQSEVYKLKAVNEQLASRLKEIERFQPNPYNRKDRTWAVNYIKDIEDAFLLIEERIYSMFDAKRSLLVGDAELQALIEGMYTRMRKRFIRFIHEWEGFTGIRISKEGEDFWRE